MAQIDNMFKNTHRRDAYYDMINKHVPDALVCLHEDLVTYDFSSGVESLIKYNSPAIKISIDCDAVTYDVYILFDSSYGVYAVGQDSLTGNFNSRTFNSAEEAIEELSKRLKQIILA